MIHTPHDAEVKILLQEKFLQVPYKMIFFNLIDEKQKFKLFLQNNFSKSKNNGIEIQNQGMIRAGLTWHFLTSMQLWTFSLEPVKLVCQDDFFIFSFSCIGERKRNIWGFLKRFATYRMDSNVEYCLNGNSGIDDWISKVLAATKTLGFFVSRFLTSYFVCSGNVIFDLRL